MWSLVILLVVIFLVLSFQNKNENYTPPFTSLDIDSYSAHKAPDTAHYNGSLYDPTLVRITSMGPYGSKDPIRNRGCLFLVNPGTLVNRCQDQELKTSSQWYLTRPDQSQVILNAQGWIKDLANPTLWWYNQLIPFEEYNRRLNQSVVGPLNYPEVAHEQPF